MASVALKTAVSKPKDWDEVDVVVDGLGDADDGDLEVARLHFTADAQGGLHAAVTADDEQDADVGTLQAVHDLFRGLGPA